ncbi:hypothetical protein BKA93DRAFT_348301 [Sparassis latifolia]
MVSVVKVPASPSSGKFSVREAVLRARLVLDWYLQGFHKKSSPFTAGGLHHRYPTRGAYASESRCLRESHKMVVIQGVVLGIPLYSSLGLAVFCRSLTEEGRYQRMDFARLIHPWGEGELSVLALSSKNDLHHPMSNHVHSGGHGQSHNTTAIQQLNLFEQRNVQRKTADVNEGHNT